MTSRLAQLSDEELLQRVWIERDPLTTTDLETALAERFQSHLEAGDEYAAHIAVLDEFEATADQVRDALQLLIRDWPNARELLAVLNDFDYDNGEILRGKLARLQQFDQAMEDLREPLQSLTTLATTE